MFVPEEGGSNSELKKVDTETDVDAKEYTYFDASTCLNSASKALFRIRGREAEAVNLRMLVANLTNRLDDNYYARVTKPSAFALRPKEAKLVGKINDSLTSLATSRQQPTHVS